MAVAAPTRVKTKTAQATATCPACDNGTMDVHIEADIDLRAGASARSVVATLDRSSVTAGLKCQRCDYQQLVPVE